MTPEQLLAELGIGYDDAREQGPAWAFRARADELVPLWRRLRAAHDRSGLWPVLIGDDFDNFAESFELSMGEDTAGTVAEGLTVDVEAGLAEVSEDAGAPERGRVDAGPPQNDDRFYLAEKAGWIALIRAEAGYTVPGLLDWDGAANHAVGGALHVGVLKRWHDRFGAELVGLGRDIIELSVARPPTDPAEVLAVAEEQYRYCPDVVDQGVRTLDALMAVQVPATRWFFWWD